MKKYIEYFKELKKKPYGKSIIFFGFYLIFFIMIGLMFLFSGEKKITNTDNNNGDTYKNLFSSNQYSFTYKVVLDGINYMYSVNKIDNSYNFIYDNKEYKIVDNKVYSNDIEVENPIMFSNFFNGQTVLNIVNNSYEESKTTYNDGSEVYNLLVSSNTLDKIMDNIDTDYEEIPNKIIMSLNSDKKLKELNYNLDSYCLLNKLCNSSLNIIISYNN